MLSKSTVLSLNAAATTHATAFSPCCVVCAGNLANKGVQQLVLDSLCNHACR